MISAAPSVIEPGQAYSVQGYQLTGLSQAVSYGDDASMATNYPIFRVDVAGLVFYARTSGLNDMGVARGMSFKQSCQVTFPATLPHGNATLSVIANGIRSKAVAVVISTIPTPPLDYSVINVLKNSLEAGPLWLIDAHGPSALLLHDDPPNPAAQNAEAEVRKIYADLIAAYSRLRELGQAVLPPRYK
jgi:hypothetical protein